MKEQPSNNDRPVARPGEPITGPLFIDHALSARLESIEAEQLAGLVRAVSARLPERRAASLSIAGGVAAYIGPSVSTSRAAGLGMSGPVEDADVAALVDFYRSRGMAARILVSPFADQSLFARLGEHGFRLSGLDTILVRPLGLARAETPFSDAPAPGVSVRVATHGDAATWVEASLSGFGAWRPPGSPEAPASEARAAAFHAAFEASFADAAITYWMGSVAGVIAGAAALHLRGGAGYFFAASTLEAHRGRGVQRALILARLQAARDAGCDLAFTGTAPGGASQRNFERLGFVPAYSQALLQRAFA